MRTIADAGATWHNMTYSFIIANCQTAVVHKNKTKRRSKTYKVNTYNHGQLYEYPELQTRPLVDL